MAWWEAGAERGWREGGGGAAAAPALDEAAAAAATAAVRVYEQVEKDLRRTEVGTDGAKLCAMRRVLCAYASFNPEVPRRRCRRVRRLLLPRLPKSGSLYGKVL